MTESSQVPSSQGSIYNPEFKTDESTNINKINSPSSDKLTKNSVTSCFDVSLPQFLIPTLPNDPLSDVPLAQKKHNIEKMIHQIIALNPKQNPIYENNNTIDSKEGLALLIHIFKNSQPSKIDISLDNLHCPQTSSNELQMTQKTFNALKVSIEKSVFYENEILKLQTTTSKNNSEKQNKIDQLEEELKKNKLNEQKNLKELLDFIKIPFDDKYISKNLAKRIILATDIATKIIEIIKHPNSTPRTNIINSLKAFVEVEGLINLEDNKFMQEVAEKAEEAARIGIILADLAFNLSLQMSFLTTQIQDNQETTDTLQSKLKALNITADSLSGAIAAASIGCAFGIGCIALAALSASLAAVLASKGALETKLGNVLENISQEESQKASIQKEFTIVEAESQQMENNANQFINLVGDILKIIQENTKSVSQAIEAIIQSEHKLSSHE